MEGTSGVRQQAVVRVCGERVGPERVVTKPKLRVL